MSLPATNGETVTIIRQTRNQYGDKTPGASIPVDGCAVYGTTTTETIAGEDVVVWGLTVLMPPDTDVLATDRVNARGITYDVSGEPILHRSAITGHESSMEVHLTTATG